MKSRRIASGLFLTALLALFAWALLTAFAKGYFSHPERFFGISTGDAATDTSADGDVLYDDDATVDWSDPKSVENVFGPAEKKEPDGYYEFALTPEYFNALLAKYGDTGPIRSVRASFAGGEMILQGDAAVAEVAKLLDIPAALVIFLPETVACTLHCVPQVEDGKLRVKVTSVSAGSDVLAPYLSRDGVLATVETCLNEQLVRYLPSNYTMQSATVSDGGIYVRFRIS